MYKTNSNLDQKKAFSSQYHRLRCALHSAPYRACVSDYSGLGKDWFYLFKQKPQTQKNCVFHIEASARSPAGSRRTPALISRPPKTTHHISSTHTKRGRVVSSGPQSSFKHEELNACTREEEKIIELIRSHHLINLHADQFSGSIQAPARQQQPRRKK